MHLCLINILIFTVSTTCFEPEGSSLGRRLYVPVWCNASRYNILPEDEPLGSKHAEDIVKFKTSLFRICMHGLGRDKCIPLPLWCWYFIVSGSRFVALSGERLCSTS